MNQIYDRIGNSYSLGRRTEPRIARKIWQFLDDADSILNIGAGTGSYEPQSSSLVAIEPSLTMIRQRGPQSAAVIQSVAEQIPFAEDSFSHTMTIVSMHHWRDKPRAFDEIRRVTKNRFVALTWDPDNCDFWLARDYFPEILEIDRKIFPSMEELESEFGNVEVRSVPIPEDCIDGFLASYWKRPMAYLDQAVRNNISTFSVLSDLEQGLAQLAGDLESGRWLEMNRDILDKDSLDAGYRLVIADL